MPKANPKSPTISDIPFACSNETAAVEFVEQELWGEEPICPNWESKNVYQMKARDGSRNARYLWKCHDCKNQYTNRIETVLAPQ
jgi:transposase-like protein